MSAETVISNSLPVRIALLGRYHPVLEAMKIEGLTTHERVDMLVHSQLKGFKMRLPLPFIMTGSVTT